MSRRRILVAAISLIALVLTATALSAPAQARSAKKPVPPKVGQCRTTTYNQGFNNADPRKPVPCTKPHTMRTFAVVTVPKRFNLKKVATKALNIWVFSTCSPKFAKAQGGSRATRALSDFTWWSFFPTKAEIKKGARWLRCDISLLGTHPGSYGFLPKLPDLPFPIIGNRPITDTTRRCLANDDNLYLTPCAYPHVARADQTFVIDSKAYPSKKTMTTAAATACPGKRFSAPYSYDWSRGDHTMTCYSITTS